MQKTEFNKQIALKWIAAFNEHDIEKLLSLYSEDAVHFSPGLNKRQPGTHGFLHGKPELRSWWTDAFARLPQLQYNLENLIVSEDQVLMEYMRKVPGEPDMMVAEILEIANGVIFKSRLYQG